jgi:hypothetical protein
MEGCEAAKDHEAIVDDRKVIALFLAFAFVLLGSLTRVTLPPGHP